MERTKAFAIAAALVAAGTVAVMLTGGAAAASWHTYKGDMFAGHAYGLQVPPGAESIEFAFEGSESGLATLSVYAPDGAKVGSYELSAALTAASIANPTSGRYVAYVYEVTDGALTVRVSAPEQPAKLELDEVDLLREDTTIGTFEQGKLDQSITTELKIAPVFLTLLYKGSASDLDATVSSPKGAIVTITDESASAFSPGVWTTLKGERAFEPANLEGKTFTVEAHAKQFEGTLVLTTVALDLRAPPTPLMPDARAPMPPAPPSAPGHAPAPPAPDVRFDAASAHFALEEGAPVAFEAPATTLVIQHPEALACEAEEEEESHDHSCASMHGTVAVYAPDDSLVALVELSRETPAVAVVLPAKGEYVAYARHVEDQPILAKLVGVSTPPALRTLETAEEVVEVSQPFAAWEEATHTLTLANAPIDLRLRFSDGIGSLSSIQLENENGLVAEANALVVAHELDFFQWSYVAPEHFAKGEHSLGMHGVYEGTIEVVSTYYVRASEVTTAAVEDEDAEEAPKEPADPISWVRDLLPF